MIIPIGYAQVNLRYTGVNLPTGGEVTFGVNNTASDLSPTAVASAVSGAYTSALLPGLFSADATLTSIYVKKGSNEFGPFGELATAIPGTDGADPNPPQVALLVKKNTAVGGRAGAGRMYWPNIPANKVLDDGNIDAVYQTNVNTRMGNFLTALDGAGIPMVLLHGDVGAGLPYTVLSLAAQVRAATQRRRQRR